MPFRRRLDGWLARADPARVPPLPALTLRGALPYRTRRLRLAAAIYRSTSEWSAREPAATVAAAMRALGERPRPRNPGPRVLPGLQLAISFPSRTRTHPRQAARRAACCRCPTA